MKKFSKILLFIISLAPISAWILVMAVGGVNLNDNETLFYIILTGFILIPIQWILYIPNVFRNTTVAKNQKGLWVTVLLFFHFVIFPFYWYLHIWKDDNKLEKETEPEQIVSSNNNQQKYRRKTSKIIMFLINFLPIIFFIIAVYVMFLKVSSDLLTYSLTILFFVSLVALIIFYVFDVYHNHTVNTNQKTLWTLVLIFGNIFIFPFYWYFHIWKEPVTKNPNSEILN